MKQKVIFTTIIALVLSSQFVLAGSVADIYATGETLTAVKMNNIKDAVNDNDVKINATAAQSTSLSTGCPTGQTIQSIANDGTITCSGASANILVISRNTLANSDENFTPTTTFSELREITTYNKISSTSSISITYNDSLKTLTAGSACSVQIRVGGAVPDRHFSRELSPKV